jgi:hypothetical protein
MPHTMTKSSPSNFAALPSDESIAALTGDERHLLAERWASRSRNELRTSTTFSELSRGLVLLGAPAELVGRAERAVEDEVRHAAICRQVASSYADSPSCETTVEPTAPPRFAGASERDARVLHVVLHACLNEGFAVAYLSACLSAATAPLARAAVRELMRDEVEHARLGWAFLAWISPADRALVQDALPALVSHAESLWLDADGYPERLPPGHGCLDLLELRALVASARAELIVPGFLHLGFSTARLSGLPPARERHFGNR